MAPDGWVATYAQLDRLADRVAAGYHRRGIGTGDVVALVLPSSPEYLVAYVAAARVGAITAGINPRAPAVQRRALLDVADPALTVGTPELLAGATPPGEVVVVDLAEHADGCLATLHAQQPPPALAPDPDRPVATVFTSGTSGTPRGAVFTAAHLIAIDNLDTGPAPWGSGGPMLVSTELVHVGVMTKLAWYLRLGSTLHLLRRWRARDALEIISRERIRSVGAIAPQIALLLRDPEFDSFDLDAVETIVAGGAPSPPSLVEEARRRFGARYSIRYSSTESGGVGTGTAFDAPDEEALFTVGRPRDGVVVSIRDDDGAVAGEGETGTIWLRSPAVMQGYWRNPSATGDALCGGWLRTGDLGVFDDRGCLRLVGRAGDMFIRGGYNVHPEVVEAVLARHPAVAEVAVVPRPDDVLGEIGVAVVVPRDGQQPPELDELRHFAAADLAHHELPEALRIVTALPRTPLHKLDRRRLRENLTPPSAAT